MDEAMLVLRVVVGAVMFFHGCEKLFGWWGGEGRAGATEFFARQGYRPPALMAVVAGAAETAAGALLVTGLVTPLACLLLISTLVNVAALHLRNGLSRRTNGCEYELVLLAATVAVLFGGAGRWSLDALLGVPVLSLVQAVTVLAAAVVGGLVVVATRRTPTTIGAAR
ncbi:MAG TPA: DoxX family protein [Mycobacterium sp.]|jgi:putative oxidoreductase|nr:DoxX family protein [Mycobacterium sp.]